MNFDILTTLDIEEARAELAINSPMWDAFTLRQTFTGTAHADTKCILLRGPLSFMDYQSASARHFTLSGARQLPACAALVNKFLAGMPIEDVGKVMLVSLKAGGKVLAHADEGTYAEQYSRYHIVITSEPGNTFFCGDESLDPTPGMVFQFNHHLVHSVANESSEDRVHVIVDLKLKEHLWQSQP